MAAMTGPRDDKPATEIGQEVAEIRQEVRRRLAEWRRPERERKLRAGLTAPRTTAEWAIFATDVITEGTDET